MGTPVKFDGANFTFSAPPGRDDVQDLPVFTNGKAVVSAWVLTDDERAEIARTGTVYLSVLCGYSFYPAFVGSEREVKSVVLDSGPAW